MLKNKVSLLRFKSLFDDKEIQMGRKHDNILKENPIGYTGEGKRLKET